MKQTFRYESALNAFLFALSKLGGKSDMHKLCKILYFADQHHLSLYGRSITGDTYIAMQYGPVPSNIDDILKAVRGDSFFSGYVEELKEKFTFENRYIIRALSQPDLDELSNTDIECLPTPSSFVVTKTLSNSPNYHMDSHGAAPQETGPFQ